MIQLEFPFCTRTERLAANANGSIRSSNQTVEAEPRAARHDGRPLGDAVCRVDHATPALEMSGLLASEWGRSSPLHQSTKNSTLRSSPSPASLISFLLSLFPPHMRVINTRMKTHSIKILPERERWSIDFLRWGGRVGNIHNGFHAVCHRESGWCDAGRFSGLFAAPGDRTSTSPPSASSCGAGELAAGRQLSYRQTLIRDGRGLDLIRTGERVRFLSPVPHRSLACSPFPKTL